MRLLILIILFSVKAFGDPFWTEKSSFTQGDLFYAVGVSTHGTLEERRQVSLANAIKEIESSGIQLGKTIIHTARLYEASGKTYRLVYINLNEIRRQKPIVIFKESLAANGWPVKKERKVFYYPLPTGR